MASAAIFITIYTILVYTLYFENALVFKKHGIYFLILSLSSISFCLATPLSVIYLNIAPTILSILALISTSITSVYIYVKGK
jgi:hypothetical protein